MLDMIAESPTKGQLQDTHLWDRLVEAKRLLKSVHSQYRVVFEDPEDIDAPAKVLIPDPNWMAAALHGGILPSVEEYQESLVRLTAAFPGEHPCSIILRGSGVPDARIDCENRGGKIMSEEIIAPAHPYAPPIGPMTEEEAIEYLIQKDIPPRVWRDYRGNRCIMRIVPVEMIPKDRRHRSAWKVRQADEREAA